MKPVLRQLVDAAGNTSEPERRREAIRDIALLLKAWSGISPGVTPDALVPERLRGLSFTADDEEDLLGELRELLLSPDSAEVRPELIAALRGTAPEHSVYPLLDLLIDHTAALTDEELREFLEALDESLQVLRLPEAHKDSCQASHVALVVWMSDARPVLCELANRPDEQISSHARSVAAKVEFAATIIRPRGSTP